MDTSVHFLHDTFTMESYGKKQHGGGHFCKTLYLCFTKLNETGDLQISSSDVSVSDSIWESSVLEQSTQSQKSVHTAC